MRRRLVALALTGTAVAIATPQAFADPPNPTDRQLAQADQHVKDKAAEVGRIAAALTATDAKLQKVQEQAEIAIEQYHRAVDAWHKAQAKAKAAKKRADDATRQVEAMKAQLDQYVADSYESGGGALSLTALLTSPRPEDLVHNAGMLQIAGSRQVDMVHALDRARVRQENALSEAKAALDEQTAAKAQADQAKTAAERQVANVQTQMQQIAAQKAQLQKDLEAAQQRAGMLHQARQAAIERARREAARRAAEARAAAEARRRAAAAAAAARAQARESSRSSRSGSTFSAARVHGAGAAAIAVQAALSQVGMPYVWGASSPSIGFDCSGLTSWAYAQAGVYLDRFSGNQYDDGRHVPLSSLRPGDLLFWSSNGSPSGIHHVAMYVGGGQMVEAPTFGIPVHVRGIWNDGELLPYATRIVG